MVIPPKFIKSTWSSYCQSQGTCSPSSHSSARGHTCVQTKAVVRPQRHCRSFTGTLASLPAVCRSWRQKLVCIFTKALWKIWPYCPFLMWHDSRGQWVWGTRTKAHSSWCMWGSREQSKGSGLLWWKVHRICLYLRSFTVAFCNEILSKQKPVSRMLCVFNLKSLYKL